MTPKEQRTYEMRLSGMTFKQIAKELKYADPSGAYQAYQRAREIVSLENLSEWRLLELERLNALQGAIWGKALEGNLSCINAVLKISDLRARIIGLYAPDKIQVGRDDLQSEDLEEAVRQMTEMVDLGKKYAEEHGITTAYLQKRPNNKNW